MPLHLLGKKSWNVYNTDNVARVRRDEEAAAAAEHAAEQRMQEADAARRLAILRGETPPPLPEAEPENDPSDKNFARQDRGRSASGFTSRKRKRAGEDDTDFEMRLVRERAANVAAELAIPGGAKKGDTQIVDGRGHIDLIGPPPETGKEKNAEYEREKAKKQREMEDQYTMRFSNAAGRDGIAAGDPWYTKSDSRSRVALTKEELAAETGIEAPTKNVWGTDDPRRKARETQRMASNDPLAMMRRGAQKIREIEKERRQENEQRERELKELRREERRREKRRRKNRREEEDEEESGYRSRRESHRSEHSERRRRLDDADGNRERHRHRHRHRHGDEEEYEDSKDRYRPRGEDRDEERGRDRSTRSPRHADEGRRHHRRQHDDGSQGETR